MPCKSTESKDVILKITERNLNIIWKPVSVFDFF